jgi:hypothetical protein
MDDMIQYVKVKNLKEAAINYSTYFQVLSEYTAFICVGKKLIDSKYQEFSSKIV